MENICDGSHRAVLGKRHGLAKTTSNHRQAVCPECGRTFIVRRVLGIYEFPQHSRTKGAGGKQ